MKAGEAGIGGGSNGGSSGDAIRLLTLNAHQGFRAHRRHSALLRIREALRATDTDLVFLQEVGVAGGTDVPVHQYEVLAEDAWPQHAYGRNAVWSGGHHGNALLSKYPIVEWRNVDVSTGRAEPRGMLHCVIEAPQLRRPLHAICVHLALRESHRRRQVEQLLKFTEDAVPGDAPLVVAGDFNDWRERAHERLMRDGRMEEIHAAATGRPARTFPERWPILRVDRIYVRYLRHRPLGLARHAWSKLSDHAPLAGEVRAADPGVPDASASA
jgi:endonuclease/exonuclease/phosphatase family metal-dependent hydrolase